MNPTPNSPLLLNNSGVGAAARSATAEAERLEEALTAWQALEADEVAVVGCARDWPAWSPRRKTRTR